jgi:FMN reductase
MNRERRSPFIVGIGGTVSPDSQTEQALAIALNAAKCRGATTRIFGGETLASLPHYLTPQSRTSDNGMSLIESVRRADGVILASPGYHGSISGLLKNALDYFEELSKDERAYLDGVPVGIIVTAYGWQATGTTMSAMRSIVHALRGWPTPLGVALNVSGKLFYAGQCEDAAALAQLDTVGSQVVEFAKDRFSRTDSAIPAA